MLVRSTSALLVCPTEATIRNSAVFTFCAVSWSEGSYATVLVTYRGLQSQSLVTVRFLRSPDTGMVTVTGF